MKLIKKEDAQFPQPFKGFLSLKDDIDSLFENFWDRPALDIVHSGFTSNLAVDISENDKEVIARADIPGMNPDDITIEVDEGSLSLSGEYKQEDEQKDENYYRVERSYGKFSRHLALPAKIDADSVEANAENGVLTITMKKLKVPEKKKVTVKKK